MPTCINLKWKAKEIRKSVYQNLYNQCHLTLTQKKQETTSISCNKECDRENTLHGMHVCGLISLLKEGIWQTIHFARFFPESPKLSPKIKTERGQSQRISRESFIQLSHCTDGKPEVQRGWNVWSTAAPFVNDRTRTWHQSTDLSPTTALRQTTDGLPSGWSRLGV